MKHRQPGGAIRAARYNPLMLNDIKAVREAAMALSKDEREVLAVELFESLAEGDAAEIEQAWLDEADRRLGEYDRGDGRPNLDGETVIRAFERGEMP